MWPNIVKQILDNFHFRVNPELTPQQNAEEVTRSAALLAAAVSTEPIPFADILLISPIQMKMVTHIGIIYGFAPTPARVKEIVAELGATFAVGFLGRQVVRGLVKMVAPGIGGLITAPAVYGWTFGLGRLAEGYFKMQLEGKNLGQLDAKTIAQHALEEAKEMLPSVKVLSEFADSLRERSKIKEESAPSSSPVEVEVEVLPAKIIVEKLN
jgi:uncharacterized protein (DUF697 family)